MDFSKIKIANTRETVTLDFLGVKLEIARGKNEHFKRRFTAITKPYSHQMANETISEEKSEELLAEALAGTVLIGWSNFFIDGEEFPYSEESAKSLLINDPDCRAYVLEESENLSRFLKSSEDESVKKW